MRSQVEPKKTTRSRGRPGKDAGDLGRKVLLDAALAVLSRTDPALVTRQMLADEAGVDPQLVRYYFGNTQALLTEVGASVSRLTRREMQSSRSATPVERLRHRIRRTFELFNSYRWHYKVVTTYFFDDTNPSAERQEWLDILKDAIADLSDIVASGVEDGSMRPVDHHFLHMMIVSTSEFWSNNEALLGIVFGAELDRKALDSRYVEFLCDAIERAVAASPEPSKARARRT